MARIATYGKRVIVTIAAVVTRQPAATQASEVDGSGARQGA